MFSTLHSYNGSEIWAQFEHREPDSSLIVYALIQKLIWQQLHAIHFHMCCGNKGRSLIKWVNTCKVPITVSGIEQDLESVGYHYHKILGLASRLSLGAWGNKPLINKWLNNNARIIVWCENWHKELPKARAQNLNVCRCQAA